MRATTELLRDARDSATRAINTIDYPHHEMHEGSHFYGKNFVNFDGGNDETQYFMFITPDSTVRIHAKASFYANVEFEITIFEDATVSDNGIAVAAFNNDRDSSKTPLLDPYVAPTITDIGNNIWQAKTGSARSSTGVSPGFNYEIIAKRNSVYLFELIKKVVNIGYVDLDFWWYEHEPKTDYC